MIELKKEWEEYQKNQNQKMELPLDQVKILSWVDSKGDTAIFREIDPLCMDIDAMKYPKTKLSGLTPAQLELISVSGIALYTEKKVFLVDKLLFRSFVDLFGFTRLVSNPSIWRDLFLADLFHEQGESVTATYRWCDNRRVIMAFHKRDLQAVGINIYSLATEVIRKFNAELIGCVSHKTKFQVELALHEHKDSWRKTLVLRDDCIGRESLTVVLAYRHGESLVYMKEIKKSHRIKVDMENILDEIEKMISESSFSAENVSYNRMMTAAKSVLGKKKFQEFILLFSKQLQELGCCIMPDSSVETLTENNCIEKPVATPMQLLEIAASVTASQLGDQENDFRFRLGTLCGC